MYQLKHFHSSQYHRRQSALAGQVSSQGWVRKAQPSQSLSSPNNMKHKRFTEKQNARCFYVPVSMEMVLEPQPLQAVDLAFQHSIALCYVMIMMLPRRQGCHRAQYAGFQSCERGGGIYRAFEEAGERHRSMHERRSWRV